MRPVDALLLGVSLLAALLFIGGLIDVFRVPVRPNPRQRRRRVRRRPDRAGLAELLEESLAAQPLPRRLVIPGDGPSAPKPHTPEALVPPKPRVEPTSPVVFGTTGTPVTPKVTWSARPLAATVLRQATSAFHQNEVTGAPDERSDIKHSPLDDLEYGKIVARYTDGRIIKGFTYNFYPNKLSFHILPAIAGLSGETIEVWIKDLKAVFFVRDFGGNPSYKERKEFAEGERPPGRKVEVAFADGEVLVGSTVGYDTRRQGFFLIPVDPKTNNLKVFVVSRAVTKVRFLQNAREGGAPPIC